MNQDEYLEKRLDDQIKWYSAKSAVYQKKHKYWQVIKIISALLITTLTLWLVEGVELMKFVIGILGAFIVFIESFVNIFNYKELWVGYRNTSEKLKREKLFFQTKAKSYQIQEPFELLVQRCEAIMQNENQDWGELIDKKEN